MNTTCATHQQLAKCVCNATRCSSWLSAAKRQCPASVVEHLTTKWSHIFKTLPAFRPKREKVQQDVDQPTLANPNKARFQLGGARLHPTTVPLQSRLRAGNPRTRSSEAAHSESMPSGSRTVRCMRATMITVPKDDC